jgi:hypothetical protein
MLTEDKINLNFANFVTKLEKYGIYSEEMKNDEEFIDKLRTASAFTSEETGGAYEGSLVEHITRIALIAFNINKILYDEVKADEKSLIKVCYIHQLSKAIMIVKNGTDWEVKKGKHFTFKKDLPALKVGEYSLYICAKYGIELTTDEYTAISSTDKENDDQTKYFSTSLSEILRKAIELANTERRLRYKYYQKA